MSLLKKFSDWARGQASPHRCDQIVISGGGLAGLFSAYELLRQAKEAGRKLDVVVLADRINAPCTAGSHIVLEHEGLFDSDMTQAQRAEIAKIFRSGQAGLESMVAREKIDCSLARGYEWKSKDRQELIDTVDDAVEKQMYRRDEFNFDRMAQEFNLPGYDHSVRLDCIGQVNMDALIHQLVDRLRDMGGRVIEGARYERQEKTANGQYLIHSNVGTFISRHKPLIATGPAHMQTLPGFNIETSRIHTMGLVFGPLDPEDRLKLSAKPVAFCDTNMDGDVLWGGIDDKGHFTVGRGDLPDGSLVRRDKLTREICDFVDGLYPGLTEKYVPATSFGSMLHAENHLPIVGRMKDYDVMGGWAGEGIVPGYAAAQAYAKWILHKDDTALKVFESFQPEGTYEATLYNDNIPGAGTPDNRRGGKDMTPPPSWQIA